MVEERLECVLCEGCTDSLCGCRKGGLYWRSSREGLEISWSHDTDAVVLPFSIDTYVETCTCIDRPMYASLHLLDCLPSVDTRMGRHVWSVFTSHTFET